MESPTCDQAILRHLHRGDQGEFDPRNFQPCHVHRSDTYPLARCIPGEKIEPMRFAVLVFLPLASSLSTSAVQGQSAVRGSVRAQLSTRVVPGVAVSVEGPVSRSSKTDAAGTFLVGDLPAGQHVLWFRAVGYRPLQALAELSGRDTLELDVELVLGPQELAPLAVSANRPAAPRRKQDFISTAEIESTLGVARDADELIRSLRPSYLRGRGASTLGDPHAPTPPNIAGDTTDMDAPFRAAAARNGRPYVPKISVDDGPLQPLEVLRQIPVSVVREIRFMSSIDAAIRFGTGVEGGVIQVFLK